MLPAIWRCGRISMEEAARLCGCSSNGSLLTLWSRSAASQAHREPPLCGCGWQCNFSASQMSRVPTPASLLRQCISAPFSLDYPEEACDYLMCLNTNWTSGLLTSRTCINPDQRFWESERIASEAILTQELTHLLVSTHRPQLTKLCGEMRYETGADSGRLARPRPGDANARASSARADGGSTGSSRSGNSRSGRASRRTLSRESRDADGLALEYVSLRSRGYPRHTHRRSGLGRPFAL